MFIFCGLIYKHIRFSNWKRSWLNSQSFLPVYFWFIFNYCKNCQELVKMSKSCMVVVGGGGWWVVVQVGGHSGPASGDERRWGMCAVCWDQRRCEHLFIGQNFRVTDRQITRARPQCVNPRVWSTSGTSYGRKTILRNLKDITS